MAPRLAFKAFFCRSNRKGRVGFEGLEIQAVTFVFPSWRSQTTFERVTFSHLTIPKKVARHVFVCKTWHYISSSIYIFWADIWGKEGHSPLFILESLRYLFRDALFGNLSKHFHDRIAFTLCGESIWRFSPKNWPEQIGTPLKINMQPKSECFWSNYSDLTPSGGLVRGNPLISGKSGWWGWNKREWSSFFKGAGVDPKHTAYICEYGCWNLWCQSGINAAWAATWRSWRIQEANGNGAAPCDQAACAVARREHIELRGASLFLWAVSRKVHQSWHFGIFISWPKRTHCRRSGEVPPPKGSPTKHVSQDACRPRLWVVLTGFPLWSRKFCRWKPT